MAGELLTVDQLSQLLRIPKGSLANMRISGNGPAFIKMGARIRYSSSDVDAWLAEQRRSSTSATSAPQVSE